MKVLMLEDNSDRIAAFREALSGFPGCELIVWQRADTMIQSLQRDISGCDLVSLDHDLIGPDGEDDPGDGLQVATAMGKIPPSCPVVIHSTNVERVQSMSRELTDGGWTVHRVAPIGMGEDWIDSEWLPKIRELMQTGK